VVAAIRVEGIAVNPYGDDETVQWDFESFSSEVRQDDHEDECRRMKLIEATLLSFVTGEWSASVSPVRCGIYGVTTGNDLVGNLGEASH
jgi:hypothetical protein